MTAFDAATLEARKEWLNWPLLVLIFLLPLQNIYLGKIPSLGGGLNILNVLMLIALVCAASRRETTFQTGMNRYILFMVVSYLVSLMVATADHGWDTATALILKDTFFAYLFFFVTYKSITGIRGLKATFWATVLPLPYMFKVFYTNLSWMGFSSYKDKLRFNSGTFLLLGSNEIAAFYASYTFILLSFALYEQEAKRKWFLLACIGLNAYSLVFGFSRGAYLAALVGLTLFCHFFGKLKLLLAVLVTLGVLLFSGVEVFPQAVSERFDSTFAKEQDRDESAQSRFVLWELAVEKFESSPLLGIGFNNFKRMNEYGKDTHNYYMKVLVEGGLLGFSALLTFMAASLRTGAELVRKGRERFERGLAYGFLSCLAAVAVGNLFGDRFTHYPLISYFYVYLAMVLKALEWSKNGNEICTASDQ